LALEKEGEHMSYIYVGSYEQRWQRQVYERQLPTAKAWVLVSYNNVLDSILEEHQLFDELHESLVVQRVITITNFEQQVTNVYSSFICNNIKLLRH
jgi:hypothetical protein